MPLKPEPRTRLSVPPLRLVTCLAVAPGISFWSVFTWGIWVAEAYSMIVPLAAVALPVPTTLKPRAVSWLAVVEASPATPVPLRTWSCTWPGLTVGSDCDLAWAARRAVLRMWLSLAIARNKSSAGGWANSTRSFGLGGYGTTGAMMNCSAVVLSPLRLLAIAYMSVSVSPESVVSELAMSCTRPYSLVGADSDLDEVIDVNAGDLLQGPPQARRAAVGEGVVELLKHVGLRLLAGVPLAVALARVDRHHGVAGEADHDRAGMRRRDVQQHGRVGPGSLDAAAKPAVRAVSRVRADDQDVLRAVQLRRALAQFAAGDGEVVDAVVDVAVGGVGAERDEGDRQRGEDGHDAEHRVTAQDAPGARRGLAGRRGAPRAAAPGGLPGIGAAAATTRTAAGVPITGVAGGTVAATQRSPPTLPPGGVLASAFRVVVAAH